MKFYHEKHGGDIILFWIYQITSKVLFSTATLETRHTSWRSGKIEMWIEYDTSLANVNFQLMSFSTLENTALKSICNSHRRRFRINLSVFAYIKSQALTNQAPCIYFWIECMKKIISGLLLEKFKTWKYANKQKLWNRESKSYDGRMETDTMSCDEKYNGETHYRQNIP